MQKTKDPIWNEKVVDFIWDVISICIFNWFIFEGEENIRKRVELCFFFNFLSDFELKI